MKISNRKKKWDKSSCRKSAKEYTCRSQWLKGSPYSFFFAKDNGWLDELCSHMSMPRVLPSKWTLEKCQEKALKFKSRKAWECGDYNSYRAAVRNRWADQCCSHMIPSKTKDKWTTLDACQREAKKYQFKSEWYRKSQSSYASARRMGWLKKCSRHMVSTSQACSDRKIWTKEACLKSAIKSKTRSEWWRKAPGAYLSATNNGWFNLCCKHMPKFANGDLREERCYAKYKRLFNKLGIKYNTGVRLSSRSIIEFTIITKNGEYGVEIKHDDSLWTKAHIKNQITKYKKEGRSKKNGLKGIILSSPKGRYGYSIEQLEEALNKNQIPALLTNQSKYYKN